MAGPALVEATAATDKTRSHLPIPSGCLSAGTGDSCWALQGWGGRKAGRSQAGEQKKVKLLEVTQSTGRRFQMPQAPFPLLAPNQQRAPWPTRSRFCHLAPSGCHTS